MKNNKPKHTPGALGSCKMKRLILLVTLLTACAGPDTTFEGIHPEFQPYVDQLKAEHKSITGQELPVNIPINPVDFLDGNLGLCFTHKSHWGQAREIYINEKVLNYKPEYAISVIAHEIGHCVLGRKHDNRKDEVAPVSIMHESAKRYFKHYANNPDYYFDELFNKGSQ